jgi:hypothetical protein
MRRRPVTVARPCRIHTGFPASFVWGPGSALIWLFAPAWGKAIESIVDRDALTKPLCGVALAAGPQVTTMPPVMEDPMADFIPDAVTSDDFDRRARKGRQQKSDADASAFDSRPTANLRVWSHTVGNWARAPVEVDRRNTLERAGPRIPKSYLGIGRIGPDAPPRRTRFVSRFYDIWPSRVFVTLCALN